MTYFSADYSLRGKCKPMHEEEFVRLITSHQKFCLETSALNCIGKVHNQVTVGVYYSSYFTKGNIIFVTLPPDECPGMMRGCYGIETFTVMDKDIDKYAREVYHRLKNHFGKKDAWR